MDSDTESEDDVTSPPKSTTTTTTPPALKKKKKPPPAPESTLSGRAAPDQPVFGDSDDELLGVTTAPTPARKVSKAPAVRPRGAAGTRLAFASARTLTSTVSAHSDLDRRVTVVILNVSTVCKSADEALAAYEYKSFSPTVAFDVREDDEVAGGWDPGHDELEGIVYTAYEIARILIADEDVAVVVASKLGGDAARSLCGAAGQAVRRLAGKEKAKSIVGVRVVQPSTALAKRVVEKIGDWSEVVARRAIHSLLA